MSQLRDWEVEHTFGPLAESFVDEAETEFLVEEDVGVVEKDVLAWGHWEVEFQSYHLLLLLWLFFDFWFVFSFLFFDVRLRFSVF